MEPMKRREFLSTTTAAVAVWGLPLWPLSGKTAVPKIERIDLFPLHLLGRKILYTSPFL